MFPDGVRIPGIGVLAAAAEPGRQSAHAASAASLRIPLDLVEVAERRPPRADAWDEGGELLVRDLAERTLHAEVGQAQVLLVDDRRDAGVDLDHALANELDVEEVLDPERLDDPVRDLHQSVVVER